MIFIHKINSYLVIFVFFRVILFKLLVFWFFILVFLLFMVLKIVYFVFFDINGCDIFFSPEQSTLVQPVFHPDYCRCHTA